MPCINYSSCCLSLAPITNLLSQTHGGQTLLPPVLQQHCQPLQSNYGLYWLLGKEMWWAPLHEAHVPGEFSLVVFVYLWVQLLTYQGKAQAADTSALKNHVGDWILKNPMETLLQALCLDGSKSDCGINHPTIALLFTPWEHMKQLWDEPDREGM